MLKVNSTLAHLETGSTAEITDVTGDTAISRRLLEMGVIPGATVRVVKSAPFGDPLEIRVRNSHFALRRSEANSILVNCE
jgi:Fe2+ transport system protein FeoA